MYEIIYPHRLDLLLEDKKCDICKVQKGINIHKINIEQYLGMLYCNNEKCKEIINYSIKNTTKNADELIKTYGDIINVVRTNGKKETNWCIFGNAYKEHKDDNFWVEVRHIDKNKSKIVKLDDLDKWNNKILDLL